MLVSAFAAASIVTVQADPFDWPMQTLDAVVTTDPFWGYYGGYHDILQAIKTELLNIGIDLTVRTYDQYTWWDITSDSGWNVSSEYQVPGMPAGINGWDMYTSEWWMMPSGMLWLEDIMYNELTPPEGGSNVFPWMNEKADELLRGGQFTLDAETRKQYLDAWQTLFMADPPMINMYYSKVYEVESIWLQDYDPTAWFMEVSRMRFNKTLWDTHYTGAREPYTLIFGLGFEAIWAYNNLFMVTYTDDRMCDLMAETLYDISVDMSEPVGAEPWDWPPTGVPPNPWNFFNKPTLAADQPTFITPTHVRIPLRKNVKWSDGYPFNATDVKFTYDLVLNLDTGAAAYGDLYQWLDYVEIVNETCVDLFLKEPGNYADLANILSDEWGLAMVPWHTLKGIAPGDLSTHVSNVYPEDAKTYLPALGPFMLDNVEVGPEITMVRNPYYFGYSDSLSPADPPLDWGPYDVSKIILISYPDPSDRLLALKTHTIDFAEYSTASKETFEGLKADSPGNGLRVWQYDYPASHPIWLNLDSPKLSNRYFRLALAYAIPYGYIYDEILSSWGVEPYAGKTFILPQHYYTEPNTPEVDPDLTGTRVRLFNEELLPYEHNITKALEYMKMWWYSTDPDFTQGPIGDADFSGLVELADYYIWADKIGTSSPWPALPGCDIDPNFNNDAYVDIDDYYDWTACWGFYYPEGSTTHEWSRYVP